MAPLTLGPLWRLWNLGVSVESVVEQRGGGLARQSWVGGREFGAEGEYYVGTECPKQNNETF